MGADDRQRIRVQCGCGAKINAPASALGRKVRCPKCQGVVLLRTATKAPVPLPKTTPAPAQNSGSVPALTAKQAPADRLECIRVSCECGAALRIPAQHAGRKAKCPKCQRVFVAPRVTEPMDPAPAATEPEDWLDGLMRGTAVAVSPPPSVGGTEPSYGLKPAEAKTPREAAPATAVVGKAKTCPSCQKSLPANAVICVECGINLKTGRPLLTTQEDNLDNAYVRAEGAIRWLSWLMPIGVYPVASEAFGLRTPWVVRAVALLTVAVSLWFFVAVIYNPEPSPANLNLMLWSGEQEFDARALLREEGHTDQEIDAAVAAGDLQLSSATIGYRPHQLLTHALLHGGLLHLAGNLLFLMVLGSRVNALIGNIMTVVLYPLLAIAAATAHLIAMAGAPSHPLLGASGAIMGLAGMYLILFPVHKVHMAAWWRWGVVALFKLNLKIFPVHGFVVVLFYIAFDVAFILLGWEDEVAHWAHLGGFLAGVGIALVLLFSRLVNARGGDILSAILGKYAWALIGKPNQPRLSLW
ncbi:MAG: rhomboid family intramembrane serine protease [Planctomycetes bacterium]|nr:rhomboid family intramembrane serine protease [Planctomycetota bacterium]